MREAVNARAGASERQFGALARARERAGAGLARWSREWSPAGVPVPTGEGQLIRPTLAYLGARALGRGSPDDSALWSAVAAVQLAHEASLVHDDIVDRAAQRRGEATVVSREGVGAALVKGDHLLAAAYRAAAATGSLHFARSFADAVERTIAGELRQGRRTGAVLSRDEYEEIVLGKSGELLGCALSSAARIAGDPRADALHELGRRVGLAYQMLDDLLDYCPAEATGKTPLRDYEQGRWTWVLDVAGFVPFGLDREALLTRLHARAGDASPLRRAAAELERQCAAVAASARPLLDTSTEVSELLSGWAALASGAVAREEQRIRQHVKEALTAHVPPLTGAERHLARNSASFRFATRFFPAADRRRVAAVYAYCRVTDDLVDGASDASTARARLEAWLEASRAAYTGRASGIDLVDGVMADMARANVPFLYVEELIAGMRMDLDGRRYASLLELDVYTYRVAGVVGQWLTELAGAHDPHVLERAATLGRAMQLTNIVRDVGEDWRRGRLYLPADALARHGVRLADLNSAVHANGPLERLPRGFPSLLKELMEVAEERYATAFEAMSDLPASFRAPVAVAAAVYRGIHRAVRRNGYDTLTRRASTGKLEKLRLSVGGLLELRSARAGKAAPARARLRPVGPPRPVPGEA